MPIAFDIASRNGSQFFFWLIEASVEMTPKFSSVVSALTAVAVTPAAMASAAPSRNSFRMSYPPIFNASVASAPGAVTHSVVASLEYVSSRGLLPAALALRPTQAPDIGHGRFVRADRSALPLTEAAALRSPRRKSG